MSRSRPIFTGVILLYFVIGLEVLIMISPFAAFFYAAFNPVLLFLARSPATRWLSAFFLPHMVLPPGAFLKVARLAGSVLLVVGALLFLVCAGQVYFRKLLRRGPAVGGLHRWIRHPQCLALGLTGSGLAILWPRFLTIVLWSIMVELYYLLARDEERRMVSQFGGQYRAYMARTGMFFPHALERTAGRLPRPKPAALRGLVGFAVVFAPAAGMAQGGVARRLIFLHVDSSSTTGPASLFAVNAARRPLFYIDLDIHNLVRLDIKDLGPGTGWGRVPTPMS